MEKKLMRKNRILEYGGNTELFEVDIFKTS